MRSLFCVVCAFMVSSIFALQASGATGESIVLDPNTGDYKITYLGTGSLGNKKVKPLRTTTFVPATKINPVIGSTFILREDNVVYSYRVRNGSTSRQSLASFLFDPVSDIVSAVPLPKRNEDVDINTIAQIDDIGKNSLTTPHGWYGSVTTSDAVGLRIGWMFASLNSPNAGLIAGSTQNGFGYSSKNIPGIVMAQFSGHSPILGFVDEGPSGEIANQLENLTQNDFVTRYAAVPTIAAPIPFDAAVLLDSIHTQMLTWTGMQLLDPAFASQLDRYIVAAANAYRSNQPKVGKEDIESVRKLLEHEHNYLDHDEEDHEDTAEHKAATRLTIDRLAARVLDFDLRYVLKRMEHEHEYEVGDRGKERN
ncbi:hypothetical protein [Sideroxydans sp. CL21]|uniref:hypothetical protein n=1 Tax=Sideroxydans sp. CL21 TaxID=2600596 RepID=UPI0024BC9E93|nr:hypothetical protein [Sideroxydans sp. CL21]